MIFSSLYNLEYTKESNWFNPILTLDTRLFIDPILLKNIDIKELENSYQNIVSFFEHAFTTAAKCSESTSDSRYRLLKNQLVFPEVREICLGYANKTTDGAGSGRGFAQTILDTIFLSIKLEIVDPSNFERISLFNRGIAEDRISDITANIIKKDLIKYTQSICEQLNIPTKEYFIEKFSFNIANRRWENKSVFLPENPHFQDRAVILVPRKILGLAPHINPNDFMKYCFTHKSQELRDEFSFSIISGIKKDQIINIAKKHTDWVLDYEAYQSSKELKEYNVFDDSKQLYNPIVSLIDFLKKNDLSLVINNKESLQKLIESSIEKCLFFLENYGEKNSFFIRDEALKSILKLVLIKYMDNNNVKISNPQDIGRNKTIFELSDGTKEIFDFKIKSATNTRFWNKLRKANSIETNTYYIVVDSYDVDFIKAFRIEKAIKNLPLKKNVLAKYTFDSFLNLPNKEIFRNSTLSKAINISEIETLITQDKVDEAVDLLKTYQNSSDINNLKAQLTKNKNDFLNGIKSLDNHNIEINRIRLAVLEIIKDLR